MTLHQSIENRLENFLIQSNSTRMMHAECLFDAGGSFELTGSAEDTDESGTLDFSQAMTISNGTQLDLVSAVVVGRDESGDYFLSPLGDWEAETPKTVRLTACQREEIITQWEDPSKVVNGDAENNESPNSAKISAYKLLKAVVENLSLGKGEVRLLGYCNDQIGNSHFIPASTQIRQQSLVSVSYTHLTLPTKA